MRTNCGLVANVAAATYTIEFFCHKRECGLTKKAEPPPTRGVNRDSGTDRANGGWLRRLVRPLVNHNKLNSAREPAGQITV